MAEELSAIERLIEVEAICRLKARRDHAVDQKDWDTYAALHSDAFVAMSIPGNEAKGGAAAAATLATLMENVTTVHHSHTPVIDFQDRDNATGTWAMEDNLFWTRGGEKHWVRGFGFYYERYVREPDGQWRFSYRKLERTHAETSPNTTALAFDVSGENFNMATT